MLSIHSMVLGDECSNLRAVLAPFSMAHIFQSTRTGNGFTVFKWHIYFDDLCVL